MLIGDIFTVNAERFPHKVALVTSEQAITYRRLEESANRIANVLLDIGAERGARVALLEKTSIGSIQVTCGIVKTGAIMVNLNNLLTTNELAKVLQNCDPTILIFGEDYDNQIRNIKEDFPDIQQYLCIGKSDWAPDLMQAAEAALDEQPKVFIPEDDIFTIIYTAGTTGEPKGACYTHDAFWKNTLATVIDTYKQTYDDVWIGPVPMYHIGGYGTLLRILVMGNTFILKEKFDPLDYLFSIEKEKVTILYAYPTMVNAMVNIQNAKNIDLSTLRLVVYGGSPIPEATLKKAERMFQCDFLQRYGATECCGSAILILSPEQHRLALSDDKQYRERLQAAGVPSLGTKVRLLDEADKIIEEPHKHGALVACLDAPMKAYWRDPDETTKTLKEGWLRLGDIAKRDEEGFYYLVDREKDMIVSGARNIYPREVEEALYSHPAVKEACVIGVPDEYWGEAAKAVVALIDGMAVTEEELIAHCKQHLASYKKPKSIDFVESLPKNPGGKVLKRELRKKYWRDHGRNIH